MKSILRRQYDGYFRVHSERANLWIHVLTVPFFMLGTLAVLASVPAAVVCGAGALVLAPLGLGTMALAMALQGVGHRREANRPEPFASKKEFFARIFLEQWVTFPRFLLSGGFRRSMR